MSGVGDPSRTLGMITLSEPPSRCPIYAFPAFMDDGECDILLAMGRRKLASGKLGHSVAPQDEGLSQEERGALTAFEQRVSLIAGGRDGADTRPVFKRATAQTDASTDSSDEDPTADHRACRAPGLPNGLHVDTHNAQKRRYASIILYLNSIPPGCGGETVFPHAKHAAAALLQANVTHTHSASRRGSDAHVAQAARDLLSKAQAACTCTLRGAPDPADADPADAALHAHIASPETQTSIDRLAHVRCFGDAIAVCPSKGLCLLFYTRHAHTKGQVDALSWHGGAEVADGHEKWILQKFETVAPGRQPDPCERKETEAENRGEESERGVRSRRVMSEEEVARHVWAHVVLPSCREMQGVTRLDPASAVAWHYVDDEKSSSTFSSPYVTAGATCQTDVT